MAEYLTLIIGGECALHIWSINNHCEYTWGGDRPNSLTPRLCLDDKRKYEERK
jgi:hypothetical protein